MFEPVSYTHLDVYKRQTTNRLQEDGSQRVLAQVNLNLDGYLRRMMRISDTMYFRVIKSTDLERGDISQQMNLLYEENRDALVSIALFGGDGSLVSATPLGSLKPQAAPAQQPWFTAATQRLENLHFFTPQVQNLFEDPSYSYRWVVSLSRHVELTRAGSCLLYTSRCV